MAEKKKFINVTVPLLNKELEVLGNPKDLENKTIKLDLSRKLKGKGVMATFQIKIIEDKLIAFPKKMELVATYIKKIMRKRIDYVEDSFQTQCKDVQITIKPFLITRKRVSKAVRKNLRNTAKEFLISELKNKTYLEISEEIFYGELQKTMLPKLKKVYPLAFCDFKCFETKEFSSIDFSNFKFEEESDEESDEEENETDEKNEEENLKEKENANKE